MKRNDLVVIFASCICTMALCFACVLWGCASIAKAEDKAVKNINIFKEPVLKVKGTEIKFSFKEKSLKPGDKPVIILSAKNNTDADIEIPIEISMSSTELGSPMSRIMPLPKKTWSKKNVIPLGKKEEKTIEFPVDKAVKANSSISLSISSAGKTITRLPLMIESDLKLKNIKK